MLQWGRTREGAEGRLSLPDLTSAAPTLQWGRTREGAEGATKLKLTAQLVNGFSGAAPVKVRKDDAPITTVILEHLASVGPHP